MVRNAKIGGQASPVITVACLVQEATIPREAAVKIYHFVCDEVPASEGQNPKQLLEEE